MWRSSGVLYLPYIYSGHSSVFISLQLLYNKTAENEQFLSKHGVWLQRESGVELSDIYVWRMNRTMWPELFLVTYIGQMGGGPRVVVSTAAFNARVRGSVPGLGGLKETNNVSSPSTCESQYCGEPP